MKQNKPSKKWILRLLWLASACMVFCCLILPPAPESVPLFAPQLAEGFAETQAPPAATASAAALAGGDVSSPPSASAAPAEKAADDWRLVLVNAEHPMEEEPAPPLQKLENGEAFDARAIDDLKQMLEDGEKEGLSFVVCSGYRTKVEQADLYEDKVRRLVKEEGLSEAEAREKAKTEVAYPRTSEHHLGLAADIVAKDYQLLNTQQEDTPESQWLRAHCAEYGFILRYPEGKSHVTGIIYEPWHYRYVGREAAMEITQQGICLEEYWGR